MPNLNTTSKQAIIGIRRQNISRTTIGDLLYKMYSQKKYSISGVKNICKLIRMDPRVLQKHIGFRIYPQGKNENHILNISSDDIEVIEKTENIYKQFIELTPEERKIAQMVFFYLVKHDG